jgi:alkanesulfonate monooxygenase SsuD/methylene tetrahydromethanopterin reductase-like flavin-dependent oxidoreductase (luciferase family)
VAALAASTSTIELGQLVMCVSFRSPALPGKMAVTADGVSGGGLVLGLGAGWYDPRAGLRQTALEGPVHDLS